jgi:alginate O-acetyltransferase complex protein AlgI
VHQKPTETQYALALGVVLNIGILCYYKYTLFLITNVDSLLQALHKPQLAIPAIALRSVYPSGLRKDHLSRRRLSRPNQPRRNFSQYLTYVLFFPKLLAGPIIKYHDIVGQFEQFPESHVDDFFIGLSRFMLGLIKKTLLADTLATGADLVFAQDPAHLTSSDAWWGSCSSHCKSISTFPAIPTWRSASHACSASGCSRTSTNPTSRPA